MLYSKQFAKTNKNAKEFESKNATLLIKAGFIDQVMAGVYIYLPLGVRVLSKIETIIREEMDKIASEVFMSSLAPQAIWEQTKRLHTIDVLMKTTPANDVSKAKNDNEYVLSPTHEDMVTPLAQKFYKSYKDFPFAVYQIQTKFRNEPRAKSGLLRCREFRMKDLYSFHTSEADLLTFYEKAKEAYWNVFNRIGIGPFTKIVLASGGDFTRNFSHEYQTLCSAGEDTIFYAKSKDIAYNREIAPSEAPKIEQSEEIAPLEEVPGEGIIGVEALAQFLKIPVEKTTKTILFETETGTVVAAAVRGDYEINELKLLKVLGCQSLKLASAATVKRVTNAEIGYAGILNLPADVTVIMDDSLQGRVNFEMGANKTNYHSINVNFERDLQLPSQFYDIKLAKQGDLYPETGEEYEVLKMAEVGNIFPLETKFSKAFDYRYLDENGKEQPIYMGSYGIGPSRVMGVLVEVFSDEKGLVWPESVAPYQVHLVGLDLKDETVRAYAFEVYEILGKQGIEVLFDDRIDVTAGAKFADADLIGIPHRLVVSRRLEKKIEYKKRTEKESKIIELEDVKKIM
ncbi:proline--tRNA ligase [Candidatus Roizmanbacteria bacterium]|nr:proline--tRNA ligase [Candidatus Roizmanbacteria bacterium]